MSCGCCLEACPQYLKIELERLEGETDEQFEARKREAYDQGFIGPHAISQAMLFNMNPIGKALAEQAGVTDLEGVTDAIGMLIDGVRVQLSDPGGPVNQSGERVVSAALSAMVRRVATRPPGFCARVSTPATSGSPGRAAQWAATSHLAGC